MHEGVRILSGASRPSSKKQPTVDAAGNTVSGPEELGKLWQKFLQGKFSSTQLEVARDEYADIDTNDLNEEDDMTISEFMDVVSHMKTEKSAGPDTIPAEVYQNSSLAKHEMFFFLRQVWRHECVPESLVLCMFIMHALQEQGQLQRPIVIPSNRSTESRIQATEYLSSETSRVRDNMVPV